METPDASAKLAPLSLGFRERYLPYDDLTRQVRAWADAFPDLVRLTSLVRTQEGRDLWLLTLGREPERLRPAAWVDGNMHACELSGSSVALAIAEDVLRAHLAPEGGLHDLPGHLVDIVRRDVLVYVLPRMSPDGAEHVLSTGAWVRSNPRDTRLGRTAPYWRRADADGDGQVRMMRREDPAGDFVASADIPGLMLPRRLEDPGPYYCVYPEGFIENWDGFTIPMPDHLSDNETDLNRNFPYDWAPEPKQKGAGSFATSEPEARAVTEFALRHPNIFAWLNLHTFGGVYIRPAGDRPDKKMDPSDLQLYRQLEEWAQQITGYPMVNGFEEFTYEPETPLHGDLSTFAYAQLGAVAMVCELWDFWKQAGLELHRPFVWNYQRRTRADVVKMARWDREHNRGRVIGGWRPFEHPQLGRVDVGGYDPRFGIWNPPPERIAELCSTQACFFLRLAALAPRLRISRVETTQLGGGLTRVDAVIENIGYLPTNVLSTAVPLPWNDPVRARLAPRGDGVAIVGADPEQRIGHLGGWGGYEKAASLALAHTSGELARGRASWVVRGSGQIVLSAASTRVGRVDVVVEVG